MKFKKEQKPGEKPLSPLAMQNIGKQSPKLSPVDYQDDLQQFTNYQEVPDNETCQSAEKLVKNVEDFGHDVRNKKLRCEDPSGFYGANLNYFNGFDGFYIQNDINLHSSTLKLGESNYEKT